MVLRKIRWRDSDSRSLKRALNHYNRVLDSLEEKPTGLYNLEYKEVKSQILTRQGLNAKIDELKRINKENVSDIIYSKNNVQISRYQYEEMKIADEIYENKMKKKLKEYSMPQRNLTRKIQKRALNIERKYRPMTDEEYNKRLQDIEKEFNESQDTKSKLTMGNTEAVTLQKRLEEDRLKALEKVEYPSDFENLYERVVSKADYNLSYQRSIWYKENYLKLLDARYSNFDNYEEFKEFVEKMTPQDFYDYFKQDVFAEDLTYQSDQHYQQQQFNAFLESLHFKPSNKEIVGAI